MPTRHDLQALFDRIERDLILRQFRSATRRNDLLYARYFRQTIPRPVDDIREPEIKAILLGQIQRGRNHESHRQLVAAIKFLFAVTLNRPGDVVRVAFPRRPYRPCIRY